MTVTTARGSSGAATVNVDRTAVESRARAVAHGAVADEARRLRVVERAGLTFDVSDTGPVEGPVVVLLHGWPGGSTTWQEVVPLLHDRGFRCVVPDQRGYSPRARPRGVRSYVILELVADALAIIDGAGEARVHLVGHDWGGVVGWALAAAQPERLASLTVLSTPHPAAMAKAMWSSAQGLRSSYAVGFQVPIVAERVLLARGGALLRTMLERSGLDPQRAAAYVERQREPGALPGSLGWYRAIPFSGGSMASEVAVPTCYAWSTGDAALGRRAAELTAGHVVGPYRFEVLEGVSHWIPEEVPNLTATLIAEHVAAHPAA